MSKTTDVKCSLKWQLVTRAQNKRGARFRFRAKKTCNIFNMLINTIMKWYTCVKSLEEEWRWVVQRLTGLVPLQQLHCIMGVWGISGSRYRGYSLQFYRKWWIFRASSSTFDKLGHTMASEANSLLINGMFLECHVTLSRICEKNTFPLQCCKMCLFWSVWNTMSVHKRELFKTDVFSLGVITLDSQFQFAISGCILIC